MIISYAIVMDIKLRLQRKHQCKIIQTSTGFSFDLACINCIYIHTMIVACTFFKEGQLQRMDNICLIVKKILISCCSYHSLCHIGLADITLQVLL